MSQLTNYTDTGQMSARYQAIGSPAWANELDRAMKRAISAVNDGTVASQDAKAQILDDWADNIKVIAAAIHSGTPS
jgi:hypothetical protein